MGYRGKTADAFAAQMRKFEPGTAWNGDQKASGGKVIREFVPFERLLATADTWARILSYRAYPSLGDKT